MPPFPKNSLLLLLITLLSFQIAESQVSYEVDLDNPNSAVQVALDQVSQAPS